MYAAENNQLDKVAHLLEHDNVDPNQQSLDGETVGTWFEFSMDSSHYGGSGPHVHLFAGGSRIFDLAYFTGATAESV